MQPLKTKSFQSEATQPVWIRGGCGRNRIQPGNCLEKREILSDKSLIPRALATVRKILRDFFAECEQLLLLPASPRFRSPAQPPGMMIIKQNKSSSTSHTPYKMVTIVSNCSVKHSEAADRVKKFCKSKMIHCSALTEGKFVKHANFI